jgi:ferredoxin
MDCCRSSRRLGGEDVKVIVRSGFQEMKASPWEKEDAMHEDIPILNFLVPKEFTHENGRLTGVLFEKVKAEYDAKGRRNLVPTGEPHQHFPCDDVLVAVGQENAFPWIERDIGLEFDKKWDMPVVDKTTFMSSRPGVFFGGDAAFGPANIIWAVEHGHQAAISIHNYCQGIPLTERPAQGMSLASTKMGLHEWAYSNNYNPAQRQKMIHVDLPVRFASMSTEVEKGFTAEQTRAEVERCLNCDIETFFVDSLCIECDACIDICPVDCLTITPNADEAALRQRFVVPADNEEQPLFVSGGLKQTGRVMIKDENICLHCGLCAERCPTYAWDMRKFMLQIPYAGAKVLRLAPV